MIATSNFPRKWEARLRGHHWQKQAHRPINKQRKLDAGKVRGQWESFVIDVVDGNLVVAGSDKRGTIYGIYEISRRIGVSPWYWWADVPVQHQDDIYWNGGRFVQPSPKVKYRGIFH